MKIRRVCIFGLLGTIFAFSSCSVFKSSKSENIHSGDSTSKGFSQKIFYSSLVLKDVQVNYNANGSERNFKCNIKLIKDSLIAISITSVVGIELFRIYLNQDSIYAINRTDHSYSVFSYEKEIGKYYKFLLLDRIQDLVLGNIINTAKVNEFQLLQSGHRFYKYGITKDFEYKKDKYTMFLDYIIDNQINKPNEFSLRDNLNYLHLIYSDYRSSEGNLFPGRIEIEAKFRVNSSTISMEIGNLKVLNNLVYHISVPNEYKREE
jgi:hypothetical protein